MKKLLLLAGLLAVFNVGMAATEASDTFNVKVNVVDNLDLVVYEDVDFGTVSRNDCKETPDVKGAFDIGGINGVVKLSILDEGVEVNTVQMSTIKDTVVYEPVIYRGENPINMNSVEIKDSAKFEIGGSLTTNDALNKSYNKTLTLKAVVQDF